MEVVAAPNTSAESRERWFFLVMAPAWGRVHIAYMWGGGALVSFAVATELLSRLPPFAALATRIAG